MHCGWQSHIIFRLYIFFYVTQCHLDVTDLTAYFKVQWNFLIAEILYIGDLSATATFLRNGWNAVYISYYTPELTSLQQTLPITAHITHFLREVCKNFASENVLQFRLLFLRSLLFYFLANLMTFSFFSSIYLRLTKILIYI